MDLVKEAKEDEEDQLWNYESSSGVREWQSALQNGSGNDMKWTESEYLG